MTTQQRVLLATIFGLIVTQLAQADPQLTELEQKIASKEFKSISSVLVQQQNKLQYEQYFNQSDADQLHDIRSASKSITAILFGQAIALGLFESVDQQVLPIFKDKLPMQNPFPAKTDMAFADLLMMSSPLECNDMAHFSAGNEERMYLRKDWVQFVLDLPERGTPPWGTPDHELPFGRSFSYCTGGVFLVGAAIERQSKQHLDQFAQQHLLDPLGITQVYWPRSPLGIVQGGGGARFRSQDLIKLGQLILDRGEYQEQQVIPADWVDDMLTRRVTAMPDRNIDYGYLWWIFEFEKNGEKIIAYAASGNGGNYLFVVPRLNAVVLITSTAYNTPYMHTQSQAIFAEHILPALAMPPQVNPQ
ncbi:hypothetical protein GCM10008090_24510 [Arenicella chitinivorans]|uniref:Beta-lactamase-related domain-containing protein n=1 Tax=Arenicella chitinivorans TaxID=1329800 RepID=A0A918RY95_9GAMM|nr:serine hydrolase [Arenicella chitinivorans]GHA13838.1 hypothetical protein GCM10008090_24510 [Arenicella chitinivorans]